MKTRYIDTMEFRFGRLKGFVLFLFSLSLSISIYSYNPFDSCLSVRSTEITTNLLGVYGAIVADVVLQSFGYCAYYINFLLYFFACTLLKNKHISGFKKKLAQSVISVLLFSFIINSINKNYFTHNAIIPGGYIGFAFGKYLIKSFNLFYRLCIYFAIYALFFVSIYSLFHLSWLKVYFSNKSKLKKKKSKVLYKIIKISFFPLLSLLKLPLLLLKYFKMKYRLNIKYGKKLKHKSVNEKLLDKVTEINSNNQVSVIEQSDVFCYISPDVNLLKENSEGFIIPTESVIRNDINKLSKILLDFGIRGEITGFRAGPVVSLFEFRPESGIKSSRVVNLADDIARLMLVSSVRIATVDGQDVLGIEMPNKQRSTVSFKKLIKHSAYQNSNARIPLTLGCDIFGNPIIEDLASMPHLLIAGTTGSGKSVGVNGMILSILFKMSPKKCKFIMIDPKMLEFSMYNDIPHLLMPVITDPKNAIIALKWVVREMENRYYKMSSIGVRNIYGYNDKIIHNDISSSEHIEIPFIVVIIDEMADLMIVAGKEIEVLVQRLSQMARAAGIHMIMATQRPSVDVVTGVIKANFPSRISYNVTSKIDSRTILGNPGAEQLLGRGDMLYMLNGGKTKRIHGPLVYDEDVESITNYLKSKYETDYIDIFTNADNEDDLNFDNQTSLNDADDIYAQAVRIVLEEQKTSISYIQRKLRIGYNKAANLVEQMEKEGILSKADHTGKRIILSNE